MPGQILVCHQIWLSTEQHLWVSIDAPCCGSGNPSQFTHHPPISQITHHPPEVGYSSREGRGGSLTTMEWSWPSLPTGWDLQFVTVVIWTPFEVSITMVVQGFCTKSAGTVWITAAQPYCSTAILSYYGTAALQCCHTVLLTNYLSCSCVRWNPWVSWQGWRKHHPEVDLLQLPQASYGEDFHSYRQSYTLRSVSNREE